MKFKSVYNMRFISFISIRRCFIFYMLVCMHSFPSYANKSIYYSLDSPYNAVRTHLYFLEERHYNPNIACMPFMKEGVSSQDAIDLAIKLKKILEIKGIYVDMSSISREVNYLDKVTQQNVYYLAGRKLPIYLAKKDDKWFYSDETLANIDALYKAAYPFNVKTALFQYIPESLNKKILGLKAWNYVLIFVVALVSFGIYYGVRHLSFSLFRFFLKKWDRIALVRHLMYAQKVSNLLSFCSIAFLVKSSLPIMSLPMDLAKLFLLLLNLTVTVLLTLMFYNAVNSFIFIVKRGEINNKLAFNKDLIPFLSRSIKLIIIIIGSLLILKMLGVNVAPIIASLSVSSLGVALASQDTLRNFFGSIMIFVDDPFKVGDFIVTTNVEGVVEEIGMRSTKLKTSDDSIVSVPNSILANLHINNYGNGLHKKYKNSIFINAKTPYSDVDKFLNGFKDILNSHQQFLQSKSSVYLADVDADKYVIIFELFFKKNETAKELIYRHDILMAVSKLADDLGITLAKN
jgi:MscS family membrane protein